jgi:type VI secretion system secreted protein Hcp
MAFDAFLKIDGIPGESHDDKHKNEIDVISFSLGVTRQNERQRPRVKDFQIVKYIDAASPLLFDAACEGRVVDQALFTLRAAGGKGGAEFYKIYFENVVVTNIQPGGSTSGDALPMEQLSLDFDSARIEYRPQNPDGSLGAAVVSSCSRTSR